MQAATASCICQRYDTMRPPGHLNHAQKPTCAVDIHPCYISKHTHSPWQYARLVDAVCAAQDRLMSDAVPAALFILHDTREEYQTGDALLDSVIIDLVISCHEGLRGCSGARCDGGPIGADVTTSATLGRQKRIQKEVKDCLIVRPKTRLYHGKRLRRYGEGGGLHGPA